MKTKMHIYRPNTPPEIRDIEFAPRPADEGPGYDQLRRVIEPLLDGEPFERVAVLWNGKRADMFVTELGHVALTTRAPLPRNDVATGIYRANALRNDPCRDPETLHSIAGTAIVFEDRVWF